ncbi:hypothetical protein DFH11DRAFT_1602959 [Phellopilus nigrolimitatus]|nr:hypothetical protein DFH11DRAFT_1602959 [Phellopilus nigrolimitatus]
MEFEMGYVIFPVDGDYLIWYCYASPSLYVGRRVVTSIPAEEKEFKEWRDHCNKILRSSNVESRIQELLPDFGVDDFVSREGDILFEEYCPKHTARGMVIRDHPWFFEKDTLVGTYTIDLDRMAFSVDDEVHFKLDNIPRGGDNMSWYYFARSDKYKTKYLWPKVLPEFGADLYPDIPVSVAGMSRYQELLSNGKVKSIKNSAWTNCPYPLSPATQGLTKEVGKMMIKKFLGTLSNAYRYAPTDKPFKLAAEYLLRVLVPCSFRLRFRLEPRVIAGWELTERRKKMIFEEEERYCKASWKEKKENEEEEKEEEKGQGPKVFFWFRSCLIVLSSKLVSQDHLHARIGDAVLHVQEKQLETCTALLWSMRNVVVVSIADYGASVAHSDVIPVLDAYVNDEDGFGLGVQLLMHYLRPPCVDPSQYSPGASSSQVLGTCHPGSVSRPVPLDIQLLIMSFTDLYTYETLGRTSHALRREWIRRPRIDSYVITHAKRTHFRGDTWNSDTATYDDYMLAFIAHEASTGRPANIDFTYISTLCVCDNYEARKLDDDRIERCEAHDVPYGRPLAPMLRGFPSERYKSHYNWSNYDGLFFFIDCTTYCVACGSAFRDQSCCR